MSDNPSPAYPDPAVLDTLPKILLSNAESHGGDIALREKDLGVWRVFTWSDYRDRVRDFALGLKALGVERGEVVGLIGDNRPDWIFGELAAHSVGALSLGIYRDALEEEIAYLITYAGAHVIFAEDEEQVDKLLGLEDRIPTVRYIVYSDPRGMRKYEDPRLMSAVELIRRGAELASGDTGLFERLVSETKPDDVAVLCTTSGTTSHPKLAMLQHGALVRHVLAYLKYDPKDSSDDYVALLPLSWIMEQIYSIGKSLVSRMVINFPEEPETAMNDMREIGPTFLLMAPRVWEQVAADVRSRMMDASALKRKLYESGIRMGMEAAERGEQSTAAELLLYRALRDRLGFSRLRSAVTGGAALGPDTFLFFQAMGVPLKQIYGQTELMGAYTIHHAEQVDLETVGVPFEGVDIKILNPDPQGLGEIVTRHDNMFLGYYKNEEATKEDLRDGWMHTGDAGYMTDKGHLVVIDRVKDMATTARGDRFSPQYIENKLKFSQYVAEAVILGHERDFLAAMICIRFSIVSKWAEQRRISFTTYTDLSSRPEVYELLRQEVEAVNATLPPAQRVSKFLLLYKELDADDGELTRTRKVRRGVINEKYGDIIDTIYSGADAVDVDTTIAFQDGTTQRIKTTLQIVSLTQAEPSSQAAA